MTGHLARIKEIMRAPCADLDTELVQLNRDNNHVHLHFNFPPTVAPAKLVNSLKGVSSRRMREEFPELRRHYYQTNKHWSRSYFAGSAGGAPLSVVRQYIEQQTASAKALLGPWRPSQRRAFTPTLNGGALARIPVASLIL